MIYIDFQGGAHGNFLDFVCNKFLAGLKTNDNPFNKLGASHVKVYEDPIQFLCGHFFEQQSTESKFLNSKIISIQISHSDLLSLSSVSLLRAGDYNMDNNELEINTYHKLNNTDYEWVLNNIINSFFKTQIQDSYNAVKDPDWPTVTCMQDFKILPEWIRQECLEQHNLRLLSLTADSPHCPRYILREFFKLGFKNPGQSGFMTQQKKMIYDPSNQVFIFPFSCFYNTDQFIDQIKKISAWSGHSIHQPDKLIELHKEFLIKQPYKDSKKFCDQLLHQIFNKEIFEFPPMNLLQESYLSAEIEKHFDCDLPTDNLTWYSNSKQLFDLIK